MKKLFVVIIFHLTCLCLHAQDSIAWANQVLRHEINFTDVDEFLQAKDSAFQPLLVLPPTRIIY